MQPFTATLVLRQDGTYRAPGGIGACPTGTVTFPDEIGTWRAGPRRRILFDATNLEDEIAALRQCIDATLVIRGAHLSAKLSRDGEHLRGSQRFSGLVRVRGVGVAVGVVARFTGTRSGPLSVANMSAETLFAAGAAEVAIR